MVFNLYLWIHCYVAFMRNNYRILANRSWLDKICLIRHLRQLCFCLYLCLEATAVPKAAKNSEKSYSNSFSHQKLS